MKNASTEFEFKPASTEFDFRPVYNEPPPDFFEFKPVVNDVFRALIAARKPPSTSTIIPIETQPSTIHENIHYPDVHARNTVDNLDTNLVEGGSYIPTAEVFNILIVML